jgi:NTP pyrophosphatase (non-canonical NTP hydrolase)
MDISNIQKRLDDFARQRNRAQFHSPKNLSMAISAEAAEILEIFQWLTKEQSKNIA